MLKNLSEYIDKLDRLIRRCFHYSFICVNCAVLIIALPVGTWAGVTARPAGPNGVTLNWMAPGDDGNTGTASVYDIRYSTALITENNWATSTQATGEPTPQVAGSAESFTVTSLTPSTTYFFAIKTGDEIPNWSPLSNVISVTTVADDADKDAPAPSNDLLAVNPTDSSITLTWTATGDDGNTGTASVYDIRYSTALITDYNWATSNQVIGEPSPQVAGSAESFTVYGLNESTTYYFAIKVADEVPNWSALSNVASANTGNETVPPTAPTDLIAINPTDSTVVLTWTATGDDGNTGTASVYDIRYSTAPITDDNWATSNQVTGEPTPQVVGSAESFMITGLTQNTVYYFALKVGDETTNWSSLSNEATATTADKTTPATINDLQRVVIE